MRTKNLTPFPFGAVVTSTRPPQPEMVLVVRGRFRLVPGGVVTPPEGVDAIVQGPLTGEVFAAGDDERTGELLYPGDFAHLKPHAEVMLVGTCHVPRGRRVARCPVGVEVGRWRKSLEVLGPRAWEGVMGRTAGEPRTFAQLALGWSHSFGGPGHPHNPVGVPAELGLPRIEGPDERMESPGDTPQPAGFGPVNPAWAPRAGRVGEDYGASYRRERMPYFARDFDWRYFQAAPEDQWLERLPRGDEQLVLHNLHPEHPVLSTRLPGLRIRCFVNDVEGAFREAPMVLDTIFIDADAGDVLLTWRGRTEVADEELDDVTTVLVAAEALGEARDVEHYRERLLRYERDPLALEENVSGEELALMQGMAERRGLGDRLTAMLEAESPGIAAKLAAVPEGGVDLAAAIDDAVARRSEDDEPPPVPVPSAPRLHGAIDLRELASVLPVLREHAPELAAALGEKLDDPRLRALDPNYRPPGTEPTADPPGPGANLKGRDLTGADLRGADLSRADLEGAVLTRARLRGAILQGANLEGALLFRAELDDADLRGATLRRVNAAHATLAGADLTGAELEAASFVQAACRGARFDGVRGTYAFFTRTDLSGASFREADLTHADFEDACLQGTELRRAILRRCLFYKSRAGGIVLERSTLHGCTFELADLSGANLIEVRGEGGNWSAANLEGADLRWSHLPGGHFTRARASEARFDCADLTGARFFKANLDNAIFRRAKLMSADLRKCTMHGASFEGANLYDAKLLGAAGDGTRWQGANTKRALHDPS